MELHLLENPANSAASEAAHNGAQGLRRRATLCDVVVPHSGASFKAQVHALLQKKALLARRDRKYVVAGIIQPLILTVAAVVAAALLRPGAPAQQELGYASFQSAHVPYAVSDTGAVDVEMLTSFLSYAAYSPDETWTKFANADAVRAYLLARASASPPAPHDIGVLVNRLNKGEPDIEPIFDLTLMFNRTQSGAPASGAMICHSAMRKALVGSDKAGIRARSEPFPSLWSGAGLPSSLTGGGTMVLVAMGFALLVPFFAEHAVRERELRLKHQLHVMGLRRSAYWLANAVGDFVTALVPVVLCVIVLAVGMDGSFHQNTTLAYILLFLFFSASAVSFAYLFSFLFSKAESAFKWLNYVVNIGLAVPWIIVTFVLTSPPAWLHYLLSVFPVYGLFHGLAVLEAAPRARQPITMALLFDPAYHVLPVLLVLAASAVLGMAAVVHFDRPAAERRGTNALHTMREKLASFLSSGLKKSIFSSDGNGVARKPTLLGSEVGAVETDDEASVGEKAADEDEDVRGERARVTQLARRVPLDRSTAAQRDQVFDPVTLYNLRREFQTQAGGSKVAVRSLTLSVPEGQCFGLLGLNGAGKTTTFNMLTGLFPPSGGDGFICGHSITHDLTGVYRNIGVCPQFDALWDQLTARETLTLFARVKGVPEVEIARAVDETLEELDLSSLADNESHTYSGGYKRRLSVGIAMIGNPRVVFLDEPSTGMDPESRRFLWDFIVKHTPGRSVVLTTHAMEEAEALCQRLCIMVNGEMKCLGSTQHIKDTFGSGYQIVVRVVPDRVAAAETFLRELCPSGTLAHDSSATSAAGVLTFEVRQEETNLGHIFQQIENKKDELHISDYSVSQTTLEQVFLGFARQQENDRRTRRERRLTLA